MPETDRKSLSERDIGTKFITPALTGAKRDVMSQIREEVSFTKGRVIVRGKLSTRGEPKRADYVLRHKPGIPLAVIEAKDNNHSVGGGMQQALDYLALYQAVSGTEDIKNIYKQFVAKVEELMRWCDQLEAHLATARTTATQLLDATIRQLLTSAGKNAIEFTLANQSRLALGKPLR